ncbi:MAG: GyrI-like domain-containing protein [Anaerolineales bacterium]|nr:GyrI-like domain-containing protein [Anaerolineales bacterium]
MIKIGDFSKLANVTVKTLHHYGKLGLLKPARIDRFSGYRYYTLEQLPRLNRILALKDLGFSLDQIGQMLDDELSLDELRGMLRLKRAELEQRIESEQSRLAQVEMRLHRLEASGRLLQSEVVVKSIEAQTVLSARQVAQTRDRMMPVRDQLRRRLEDYMVAQYLKPSGPWFALHEEREYTEHSLPVELAVSIRPTKRVEADRSGDIQVRELASVENMACVVHQAGYANIANAYQALFTWTQVNGYQAAGPYREVYLGAAESGELGSGFTEVQCPVERGPYPRTIHIPYSKIKESEMEPRIVTKPAFYVVGMQYIGKNPDNEIAKMWQDFIPRINEPDRIKPEVSYGLCDSSIEGVEDGEFEYVAGVEVAGPDAAVPEGMVLRSVPERKYAIFTHHGTLDTLGDTYQNIYNTWLPQSGLEVGNEFDMEVYDEDFIPNSPDSKLYIYVAVK